MYSFSPEKVAVVIHLMASTNWLQSGAAANNYFLYQLVSFSIKKIVKSVQMSDQQPKG